MILSLRSTTYPAFNKVSSSICLLCSKNCSKRSGVTSDANINFIFSTSITFSFINLCTLYLTYDKPSQSNRKNRTSTSSSSRSEEHTSELQSRGHLVCRLLLEKKNI